jgi:hypothetical protein
MQSLRINAFFGSSDLRMIVAKLQIWIVGAAYVFIAIVEKRLRLSPTLNEILQIFSLTMFDKTPWINLNKPLPPRITSLPMTIVLVGTLPVSIVDHFSKARIRNYNSSEDNTEHGSYP